MTVQLGYLGPTDSGDNAPSGTVVVSGPFTTDSDNTLIITSEAYIAQVTGSGSQLFRLPIFEDESGTPALTSTVVSDEASAASTGSWPNYVPVTASGLLLPDTDYWIGMWWGTDEGGQAFIGRQFGGIITNNQFFNLTATYASTGGLTVSGWSSAPTQIYQIDFTLGAATINLLETEETSNLILQENTEAIRLES